jgi:hypothetical protein
MHTVVTDLALQAVVRVFARRLATPYVVGPAPAGGGLDAVPLLEPGDRRAVGGGLLAVD